MTLEKIRKAISICCTLDTFDGEGSYCCDCPYFDNDNCLKDLLKDIDDVFKELTSLRNMRRVYTKSSVINEVEEITEPSATLDEKAFIEKYCHNCGTQRCMGIGTEWFEGCKYKEFLEKRSLSNETKKSNNI